MQLQEIQIYSRDLQGTIRFYHKVLGLKIAEQSPHKISFIAGASILTFYPSATIAPVYHFAFTLPNNKLKAAFTWAKRRLRLLWITPHRQIADFSNWNARSFYFQDNNGNILEFIARYSLDNALTGRFSGSSVFSISEFGIVVPDVSRFCNELMNRYAIPVYSRQPPQDHFTVLGNDEGLLIIVQRERPWYPTAIEAQPFPFRLTIKDDTGKQQFLQI